MQICHKNLSKCSSIGTEAQAKYFVEVNSLEDLDSARSFALANSLEFVLLGKGTNVVFSKALFNDEIFIKLGKDFGGFLINGDTVKIGGAHSFVKAGMKLLKLGYQDFLFMSLIPGTLGGAIFQNAGTTNEGEVRDNFLSAEIYDSKTGVLHEFSNKEMKFSYRYSMLQEEPNRYLILSSTFQLGRSTNELGSLVRLAESKKRHRRSKDPLGKSFGSTFRSRQYEHPAWWYIDQVGMRGYKVGGAMFSEQHCNWIINCDRATYNDICQLIDEAKKRVTEKFGIELQQEVVFL